MQELNWLAVIVAAASSFLLGGLWYSPMVFGSSLLCALIAAAVFAWWIGPNPALPDALKHGLLAGAGLVAASFGINYQFANRSTLTWLIDGGYHTAQFLSFGLVLGLWP
jgi:hypothetical protein